MFRLRAAALAPAVALLVIPALAQAGCSTAAAGARCIKIIEPAAQLATVVEAATMTSASAATPLVDVGDVLPRGRYSVILNADYYGLSPASDGWVYMRVGQDAYRVDWHTHEVLERVTNRVAANF